MSYVVLARKWRPQQLSDVLGQSHVTQTLQNAIASNRIAQTFLFSGPRGVGKTSMARILAKALCCESGDGPTPEPCGVCRQCVGISENSSTDVIEIDAASNTGVDTVREVIIEAVRYLPSSARYKVYIIDEVHMLSTSSFNALLKTFEEPPPHVKFVLATTDVHKVPATILSRCQRYDFRLIASDRIQSRLSDVLAAEGVEHDPGALALVARLADGSMRDAQSLLEQVLAFAGGARLDGVLVRRALGIVDAALVEATANAVLEQRPEDALRHVLEVHERGLGHGRFSATLVEHARDLVVARVLSKPSEIIAKPAEEVARLVEQAAAHPPEALQRLFEQFSRIQEEVSRSPQPRYTLEVGLARLAASPVFVPMDRLLQQLDRFERALVASGPSSSSSGAAPAGARAPPRGRPNPRAPTSRRSAGGSNEGVVDPGPAGPPLGSSSSSPSLGPGGSVGPGGSDPASPSRGSSSSPRASSPSLGPGGSGSVGPSRDASSSPRASPPSLPPGDEEVGLEGRYRQFVQGVARRRPALGASLHQVRPLQFDETRVRLACETAFDADKLSDSETRAELTAALQGFFGEPGPSLEIARARAKTENAPRTLTEVADQERSARIAAKDAKARSRASVRAIEKELGASIARVRVLGEDDEGDHQ